MAASHDKNLTRTQAVLISIEIAKKHSTALTEWNMLMGAMNIDPANQKSIKEIKNNNLKVLETLIVWIEKDKNPTMEHLIQIFMTNNLRRLAEELKKRNVWKFPTSLDQNKLQEQAAALPITNIICEHPTASREWKIIIYCLDIDSTTQDDIDNLGTGPEKVLVTIQKWISDQDCPSLGNLIAILKYLDLNNLAGKLEGTSDEKKRRWTRTDDDDAISGNMTSVTANSGIPNARGVDGTESLPPADEEDIYDLC